MVSVTYATYLFLQPLKNVKNFFSLKAVQKPTVGWIWLMGHSLLVPALDSKLNAESVSLGY